MTNESDHSDGYEFAEILCEGYQTKDLSRVAQVCAPEEVARYQREIDKLGALGLTKRLSFRRKGKQEEPLFVRTRDGKNEQSLTIASMSWTEEFRNHQGRRVARFRIRRADGQLRALRLGELPAAQAAKQLVCRNCGTTVTLAVTQTACPSCGAQFRHETMRWLVSSFRVVRDWARFSAVMAILVFFGMSALVVGVTSWVLKAPPGSAEYEAQSEPILIVYAGVVTAFVLLMLARQAITTIRWWIRSAALRRRDPHFSKQALDMIVNRVLETNPRLLGEQRPNEALLSGGVLSTKLIGYRADDDREQITLQVRRYWYRCTSDGGRPRVQRKAGKLRLPLERSWAARTPVIYVPTQYTCPRCGSRQSIGDAFEQVCAFCGTQHQLTDLDWALAGSGPTR